MASSLGQLLDERWERNNQAAQKRLAIKERAIAYVGGKCVICGYNRCPAALDFHHIDRRAKRFNISARQSWKSIVKELAQCVLLCANCHREVGAGWHPGYLDPDD